MKTLLDPLAIGVFCLSVALASAANAAGPTVDFLSPPDGSDTAPSSTIVISADIKDPDGVASAELYWRKLNQYWPCEDVPERRCSRQGDRYTWRIEIGATLTDRVYRIRARDSAGATTLTPERTVRVVPRPTGVALTLVSPTPGTTFAAGEQLRFAARAEGAAINAVRVHLTVDPLSYDLAKDAADARLWALAARVADDAPTGPQSFFVEASLAGGAVAVAGPYEFSVRGSVTQPEGNFPVFRWHQLSRPTDATADEALVSLNARAAADNDGGGYDVACPITPRVTRQGPVQEFSFGDGSLDTNDETKQVVRRPRGAYVVNEINYCGGPPDPGYSIIGCATVGSHGAIAVVNRSTTARDGRLWLHEYGNTNGLGQVDMSGNIMDDGSYITESQCDNFQTIRDFQTSATEDMPAAAKRAAPANIRSFVRRTFFEGVPWEDADRFTSADLPYLLNQLRAPDADVYLSTVVAVLGVVGDARAVEPLIAFIERGSGSLSRDRYEARKAALLSLGLIAAQTPAPKAMAYLGGGLDVAYWSRTLKWSLPYTASRQTRDWQMVKAAVWGVAVSGGNEAPAMLQGFSVRLRELRSANAAEVPGDLENLVAEALVTQEAVAAIGVEQFYRRKN